MLLQGNYSLKNMKTSKTQVYFILGFPFLPKVLERFVF